MPDKYGGGCACGALRFEAEAPVLSVSLCHCNDCRRASGAPLVAWAMFEHARFRITAGALRSRASSPGVERGFCPGCGTTLSYQADFLPGLIDLTVASFDEPQRLQPTQHIWERQRLPWLRLADDWPRHPEWPPQD